MKKYIILGLGLGLGLSDTVYGASDAAYADASTTRAASNAFMDKLYTTHGRHLPEDDRDVIRNAVDALAQAQVLAYADTIVTGLAADHVTLVIRALANALLEEDGQFKIIQLATGTEDIERTQPVDLHGTLRVEFLARALDFLKREAPAAAPAGRAPHADHAAAPAVGVGGARDARDDDFDAAIAASLVEGAGAAAPADDEVDPDMAAAIRASLALTEGTSVGSARAPAAAAAARDAEHEPAAASACGAGAVAAPAVDALAAHVNGEFLVRTRVLLQIANVGESAFITRLEELNIKPENVSPFLVKHILRRDFGVDVGTA